MVKIILKLRNNNQITMMKFGGNSNLAELLDVYGIQRLKVEKNTLYNSRLLDFYRKMVIKKFNLRLNLKQIMIVILLFQLRLKKKL